MDPITIAIIIVLCQYPLCILTLLRLFRSAETKSAMIGWNVFIIAVPIIGVLSYWIYYIAAGRKKKPKPQVVATKSENTDTETKDIALASLKEEGDKNDDPESSES